MSYEESAREACAWLFGGNYLVGQVTDFRAVIQNFLDVAALERGKLLAVLQFIEADNIQIDDADDFVKEFTSGEND